MYVLCISLVNSYTHTLVSRTQTNISAVKDGVIKTVFYKEKDNVSAFSKVVEYEEDS